MSYLVKYEQQTIGAYYKDTYYTWEQIQDMRDWLKDLVFDDDIDIDCLTDYEVIQGTDRHCEGDVKEFITL